MGSKSKKRGEKGRRNRLAGHKKVGTRRVTPMNQIPNIQHLSWRERILPEVVWIGIALKRSGESYKEVQKELDDLAQWLAARKESSRICGVLTGEWAKWPEADRQAIRTEAAKGRWPWLGAGARAMRKLFKHGATAGMRALAGEELTGEPSEEEWVELAIAVAEGGSRDHPRSIFLRRSILRWLTQTGTLTVPEEWDLDAGIHKPESERGRKSAAIIRACVMNTFSMCAGDSDWAGFFWQKGREKTPCMDIHAEEVPTLDRKEWDQLQKMQAEAFRLAEGCIRYIHELLEYGEGHKESDYRTVAEALVCRCGSLFTALASSVQSWTATMGPLALRGMIEAYIDLKYISLDPGERAKRFIEHGMGREKLGAYQAERAADQTPEGNLRDLLEGRVRVADEIIESRKAEWATDVDTGDWAKKNLRQRAIEAGVESLYQSGYQPFSDAAHNSWAHLVRWNSSRCANPLHPVHGNGVVRVFHEEWNADYMFRACKYLELITDLFAEEFQCGEGGRRIRKAFNDTVGQHWQGWLMHEEMKHFLTEEELEEAQRG